MSGTQRARRDDPLDGTPWEAVIGLEVHAQLLTRTKMFSPCEARFGAEPNTLTCPVTIGLPGSLPVVNRRAVELAIRVGCALGSRIAERTKFDRKHYFYPDLPKGYQISQYDAPIASGGEVEYFDGDEKKKVRLVRAHLEEDAGKNIHVDARPESWVDLNRAGTPLLEIVTEPDLRTPAETVAFVRMLRSILLSLDVCDGNMEEGSFRCDVNVAIRPRGATHLETRTEIKNLNSFTHIEHALRYEILRQKKLKERGGEVVQETRLYDVARDETRGMRGKEEAHDYRYFPEPDLAPLRIDPQWVASIRSSLPELPLARFERFEREGLSTYQA
ncbi:MAG TPA: Asp-tRNA(Asn)/Glu-tRNA(Gln) amidotransferase subunit GatB, partial [Planctomycetota bacterium]|nr:Asp-tRNA(Asn)/Glu-tRNA(Gln) amidotransferase subunit GatB [Planctomycetota bacterium]